MLSDIKQKEFEVNNTKYYVKRPTSKDIQDADVVYSKEFHVALKNGTLLRAKLDDYLREQGIWDDELETQYQKLRKEIDDGEYTLQKGGISLSKAREIAIGMTKKRRKIVELLRPRTAYEDITAEGMAENKRLQFLASRCTFDTTSSLVFKSLDDFMNGDNFEIARTALRTLTDLLYGGIFQDDSELPENKFLKKWKFVDDDLRYINKDGQLINEDGHLVDDKGRLISEDGSLVDEEGRIITEDGVFNVESEPFLDDDGKPIVGDISESTVAEDEVTDGVVADNTLEVEETLKE